jgi:hypothetical protein
MIYMGILESNKRNGRSNKGVVVTSRLTSDEHEKFKAICDATGYSISEAIRLLVVAELSPKQRHAAKPVSATKSNPVHSDFNYEAPVNAVASEKPDVPVERKSYNPISKPIHRVGSAKFVTERWKVNESLPCPICREWHSATNFSRHAKKVHGMTTKDIFTDFEKEADEMAANSGVEG